jgi:Uma2 family endonuclease
VKTEIAMAEAATRRWTLEEFLAFDDGTDRRFELHDGELVAMAPGSDRHSRILGRAAVAIGRQLRRPCDVYPEAGIVPPGRAHTHYRADLAVSCSETTGRQFLTDPLVVVEVLSRSTAVVDRGRKLSDYQEIASLRDILLVSSFERRVEHWRRSSDSWAVRTHVGSEALRLEAFPITLDLGELYEGILPGEGPAGAQAGGSRG